MKRVAIQGERGAYHEIAARAYFKTRGETSIELIPCSRFKDVIAEVKRQAGTIGVMAIENTIAGSLLQNHELIRASDLCVIGEQKTRITHALAALPGETIASIVEVHSHPIALMQCADYLDALPRVKIVEQEDTALSARYIAERRLAGHAAICAREAAELHGLVVLDEGIETNKRNFTRFLLLAAQPLPAGDREASKASIVFTLPHVKGSLASVLAIFSSRGINLTRIQSLPVIGREWEYLFYVDLTFTSILDYKQSLDAALPLARELKVLGEYPEYHEPVA